jgi:2-methylisocitrate lyase-like PEP mutase family enzyme
MGVRQTDACSDFFVGLTATTVIPAVWDLPSAAAAVAAGASHLFLSGGALSATLGYPDNGLIDISEVVETVRRIKSAVQAPLMVDIEAGYGSLHRLTRLTSELVEVGVDAVMIEDQEETGQSVSATPSLCTPEVMAARIRRAKDIGGPALKILARSDCIAGLPFQSNLDRLVRYRDAGADWLLPVFAGKDDLQRTSEIFRSKLWLIAVPSIAPPSYIPTLNDAKAMGAVATLVTSQIRNAFRDMVKTFELSMQGSWAEVRAGMTPAADFDRHLKRTRFEGRRS